ncbi:MAG: extracellular solute-binding protein family 3 [Solirubrobacterales bacterium]|nr:extracellular solute-binding protein family 3 [Solirubrobacterales bacterium]
MSHFKLALPLVALTVALGACGSDDNGSVGSASSTNASTTAGADACAKGSLPVETAGQLTVATDKPAYPPYFADNDPTNGKGFESAVAYAIAKQLGFTKDEVMWTVVPFNSSYAPGPKHFDFDVNQISISPARAKRVDFSSPYYEASQAVVVPPGSDLSPTSLADLKDAKMGVQIGTTSLDAVDQEIAPSQQTQVFNDSNDVVTALKQKRVDAVVTDLPTAFYITAAQVQGSKIVGQFPAPGGDKWGALLQKDSGLTDCVSKAIDTLKSSGELDRITQKWMGAAAGAPKLG